MLSINGTFILSLVTCLTGCLSTYMLVVFIDEIFNKITEKIIKDNDEKKSLKNAVEILKNENQQQATQIRQMKLTIDDLQTEILRAQPDSVLEAENERLVKVCDKLHIKCHILKEKLNRLTSSQVPILNNSQFLTNMYYNDTADL